MPSCGASFLAEPEKSRLTNVPDTSVFEVISFQQRLPACENLRMFFDSRAYVSQPRYMLFALSRYSSIFLNIETAIEAQGHRGTQPLMLMAFPYCNAK